eukprot:1586608-Rhodomonas_salina.4
MSVPDILHGIRSTIRDGPTCLGGLASDTDARSLVAPYAMSVPDIVSPGSTIRYVSGIAQYAMLAPGMA